MDYLFFCTSECDDALRDRDFYLVKDCSGEGCAREKLDKHFLDNDMSDDAEYYSVFVKGEGLKEGFEGQTHYCYRMEVIQ